MAKTRGGMAGEPDLKAWAMERLAQHSARITQDPQTNSIAALAHDLFTRLGTGELRVDALGDLAVELHADTLAERMEDFHAAHENLTEETAWAATEAHLMALSEGPFEAYEAVVSRLAGGIVFTAHPTFAMPPDLWRAAVSHGAAASATTRRDLETATRNLPGSSRPAISLASEHAEAQAAIAMAQGAVRELRTRILAIAKRAWPDRWLGLVPRMLTVASWVGYDLDGRTDIHWSRSIAFRLSEKAAALTGWSGQLSDLAGRMPTAEGGDARLLAARLAAAARRCETEAGLFGSGLETEEALVAAANALTAAGGDRMVSPQALAAEIRALAAAAGTGDAALPLAVLAAEIAATGFGTAHIHLRLNAAQIRTVIRRDLGLETEDRELGRVALAELADRVMQSAPRATNFADLFLEQSIARRQFMMCAQILKHIDADSPIRFLIAESENPATLMGALYLARQYGVGHALDLSPLFETPEALERGGRFVERLLDEPAFAGYVRGRGRLSVQLGFSDSGRFIGQIPAQMAIERIHSLIGRALAERDIKADLLVFNTHGESMGRGACPGSLSERFNHLLTPWVRGQFARLGVPFAHEVSFQGGDGFLHFARPDIARATVAGFCEHLFLPFPDETDSFYTRRDFTWDIYRAMRAWHERFFENTDYHRLLSAFTPQFLLKAGSRQARRQAPAGDGVPSPRALRAIPQNAMLHQLAMPLNTVSGLGSSVNQETERFLAIAATSPRLRGLLTLAIRARMVTSLPVLRAYARAFDPGYWTALGKRAGDLPVRAAAHQRLGRYFGTYVTWNAIHRLANLLEIDLMRLDRIMAQIEGVPSADARHQKRLGLHTLHAIRIALMMHAFSLVAQVPVFSDRHDVSRTDLLRLVAAWNLDEIIDRLCTVFPLSPGNSCIADDLAEPGYTTCDEGLGYDAIHEKIVRPLMDIAKLNETLTLAISHAYGAYG